MIQSSLPSRPGCISLMLIRYMSSPNQTVTLTEFSPLLGSMLVPLRFSGHPPDPATTTTGSEVKKKSYRGWMLQSSSSRKMGSYRQSGTTWKVQRPQIMTQHTTTGQLWLAAPLGNKQSSQRRPYPSEIWPTEPTRSHRPHLAVGAAVAVYFFYKI